MNIDDAKNACREIESSGKSEVAILIWLALILGLRLREAILIDANKAYKQAKKFGHVDIRKGTKGGRGKRVERLIPTDKRIVKALEVASKFQNERASFVPEKQKYITYYREVHRVALPILKRNGIDKIHELRAVFACKQYKKLTGYDAPVVSKKYTKQTEEIRSGMREISHQLGHGEDREYVLNSYCGSNNTYKHKSKAEIKIKQFLGKRLTGKVSTIAKHRNRALTIAKKIDKRFNKNIYQYQLKHFLWFINEACVSYTEGTTKNYVLTIKKLIKLLDKEKEWLPILLKNK
jgi:hypothetical protein